jgi:uncharacterized protein GlcG (DUF336 family)
MTIAKRKISNCPECSAVRLSYSRFLSPVFSGLLLLSCSAFLPGCSGGSSGRGSSTGKGGADAANFDCDGTCPNQSLSVDDVQRIVRQGIAGSQAFGVNSTICVVDRTGNVLALYQMENASAMSTIDGKIGAVGGLEAVSIPSTIAAVSKAGTGAYLSSQGNAFSTRTASQIIQEHFDPGDDKAPGGPLFGTQFSQLICGDVTVINPDYTQGIPFGRKPAAQGNVGPRPLPLGLSADPGGLPLYKQGDLVGAVSVEFDGKYTLDRDVRDYNDSPEESVALMASVGYEAPSERTANNIFAGGRTLKFAEVSYDQLPSLPAELPPLEPARLVSLAFYSDGQIHPGVAFGTAASGVLNTTRMGLRAAILVDGAGNPRFPTRAGAALPGGQQLQAEEVDALLDSALLTASRSRAAILRPPDSAALISIFIVDTNGTVLGFVRSQDAPLFGVDVSLQKARTALFFSSPDAAARLNDIHAANAVGGFEDYVGLTDAFIGTSILSGNFAISNRAIGNLTRPFYPDGVNFNPNGPMSLPFPPSLSSTGRSWSPFNDGLQLDLVFQRLVQPLGIPVSPPPAVPDNCTDERLGNRLRNGIQIFAGSVPLYRNGTLIGAIGISGDGIDQDDMVGFLGASRKGLDFAGHTDIGDPVLGFNAPKEIRSDVVEPAVFAGTRLRYVNCPEAPFIGDNSQNQCDGQ